MADTLDDTIVRSQIISSRIAKREDEVLIEKVSRYGEDIDFSDLDSLGISQTAWDHVIKLNIPPTQVFAHPTVLQDDRTMIAYYRGIGCLSRKRVQQFTRASIDAWEKGESHHPVKDAQASKVALFCNKVVSSIIEADSNWTLDDGHRNLLATIGVTLDGSYRNKIGSEAERVIKDRLVSWLRSQRTISVQEPGNDEYRLPNDVLMRFGSEPDVSFEQNGELVATIEVKGGTDPAGALERLGAMQKSFDQTPAGCINFLVSGVITNSMRERLRQMGIVKAYTLGDILADDEKWEEFASEVFHHALRVV